MGCRAGAEYATAQLVHEGMRDDAGAAAAFEAIVPMLRHPRCINCHSQGDFLDKEMIAINTPCKSAVDQTGRA
jgi:hypothetical protein